MNRQCRLKCCYDFAIFSNDWYGDGSIGAITYDGECEDSLWVKVFYAYTCNVIWSCSNLITCFVSGCARLVFVLEVGLASINHLSLGVALDDMG